MSEVVPVPVPLVVVVVAVDEATSKLEEAGAFILGTVDDESDDGFDKVVLVVAVTTVDEGATILIIVGG